MDFSTDFAKNLYIPVKLLPFEKASSNRSVKSIVRMRYVD